MSKGLLNYPYLLFFFFFIWGHEELAHQPEEEMGWEFEFKFWTLFLQIVFWEFFCIFPKSVWLLLNTPDTCALEAPLEASPLKALPSLWLPCVEPFFFLPGENSFWNLSLLTFFWTYLFVFQLSLGLAKDCLVSFLLSLVILVKHTYPVFERIQIVQYVPLWCLHYI